jgi:hypothetical protein
VGGETHADTADTQISADEFEEKDLLLSGKTLT